MNTFKILGALGASICGLVYLLIAYFLIGWGWSDSMPSGWTPAQWAVVLVPASLPFLFSVWIVHRCLGSTWKWTLLMEVCGLLAGVLAVAILTFAGRDFPVLVEQAPPLSAARDPGRRPALPLASSAAGIAAPDGKFIPMLALNWPPPGWGFETVDLNPKEGVPEINVYRGTNDIAASNQFLGRFQIIGLPKGKSPVQVRLIFELSNKRELMLVARDVLNGRTLKLRRLEVGN